MFPVDAARIGSLHGTQPALKPALPYNCCTLKLTYPLILNILAVLGLLSFGSHNLPDFAGISQIAPL